MLKYRLELIALQEIRWPGQGRIDKQDFTVIYSGAEKNHTQYGTGFMISGKTRKSLIEYEAIDERICKLRLKGKFMNITVLSVHAPTEDKDVNVKEDFYKLLENTFNETPNYDMKIILGDFNAKIGKESYLRDVAGNFTIHEETSENGNMLGQFAARNKLHIKSTMFPHKKIHLGTWRIPGTDETNQIDHILITIRHSTSIVDVKTCRGPNCDSDHYLVKAKIRERITNIKNKFTKKKQWNVDNIVNNHNARKEYQDELSTKYEQYCDVEEQMDINDHWSKVKTLFIEATETKVGEKTRIKHKEWFDEDCMNAIKDKNDARKKMIQRETRRNYERYREKRRVADKTCRKKTG